MTIGGDAEEISLVLDALFLARNLTGKCRLDAAQLRCLGIDHKENAIVKDREANVILVRLQRTLEIAKRAWRRYNRRASVVEGLDQIPLVD